MKARAGFLLTQVLVLPLCVSAAFAQVTELGPADQPLNAQPVQSDQGQPEQPRQLFTQQELDQMLAPIALYPDSLLSQIMMASTYPIEVVQAARWSRANPGLSGDAAVKAVEQQAWDPSVKSLVAFPQVISMMDEKLDWMERLGDAFLSQQQQVMDTVQQLRQKAQAAGNLQSNDNIRVEPQGQTIIIEQANPQVVYVPYYDPTIIYGPWWYPAYPPVYWRPWPGYYAYPGFSAGFFWGAGITISTGFYFGTFDWPHRHVTVVNVNNFYYRPPVYVHAPRGIPPGGWYHDPYHRRGVPYRDPVLRHEYARPGSAGRPDARRDFRGNEPPRVQGPGRPDGGRPDGHDGPGSNRPDYRDNRPDQRDRLQARPDNRPDNNGRPDNVRPNDSRPANNNGRPNGPDRDRPGNNGRPNGPDRDRPDARNAPGQPNAGTAPNRPNTPDTGRAEPRSVPVPPNANPAPNRSNVPDRIGSESRPAPAPPVARPAPAQARPNVESRPHIFEGVGQGPAVRDSSQRGRDSAQRATPQVRPVARPQSAAPAPRPQAAPAPRPQQSAPVARAAPAQPPAQRSSGGGGGGGGNQGQHQQREH